MVIKARKPTGEIKERRGLPECPAVQDRSVTYGGACINVVIPAEAHVTATALQQVVGLQRRARLDISNALPRPWRAGERTNRA